MSEHRTAYWLEEEYPAELVAQWGYETGRLPHVLQPIVDSVEQYRALKMMYQPDGENDSGAVSLQP
jgi:hypothetical protein